MHITSLGYEWICKICQACVKLSYGNRVCFFCFLRDWRSTHHQISDICSIFYSDHNIRMYVRTSYISVLDPNQSVSLSVYLSVAPTFITTERERERENERTKELLSPGIDNCGFGRWRAPRITPKTVHQHCNLMHKCFLLVVKSKY